MMGSAFRRRNILRKIEKKELEVPRCNDNRLANFYVTLFGGITSSPEKSRESKFKKNIYGNFYDYDCR
jgi:hypothetical protein